MSKYKIKKSSNKIINKKINPMNKLLFNSKGSIPM
jgi:hypothetical protein